MQNTLKELQTVLASPHVEDYQAAGEDLIIAMAKDGMSYKDAGYKLHCMHHIFMHAEEYLGKMALKEPVLAGQRISM